MPIAAKEKKERALGVKLFLKAHRCNSPKCAMIKKPYRPGAHGQSRKRKIMSELGRQWRENQKIKLTYGLNDSQTLRLVKNALRNPEVTGEKMIELLEKRLDNAVYRLGFAPSRIVARQFVNHGHITVNGRKTASPSHKVKIGDVIALREQSKNLKPFVDLPELLKKYEPPSWLVLEHDKLDGKVVSAPKNIEAPFDLNLVVDYYSK
ncbi:30S ribosomal protein S4 [Candidatus Wolfebacteria bacterium RIFCSPLOWO2_01_FULL_45_19]|uniref:Small ribosomal subunit protein uS4 n=1 Tax=Candidatus Wolfebacteria bacterium RIFCSPLOWO2_01_FULL_45_19 TaxID=1802557 RepID=A0A1F8DT28_9BACT|nr:MAG: 30S ribosomal protein S4 [Parcubacteria group bacterium GW2011_GWB1_45_9]OGM91556.1 MAG: 30S ribosomal protein S4 [Candidatus Wolfebacteria bacterium RIFCSPLOWO2_01_FULL_45_19]